MTNDNNGDKARELSVQAEQPTIYSGGSRGAVSTLWASIGFGQFNRVPFIDVWGSGRRDGQLRALSRHMDNTLAIGAITTTINKVAQTSYELSGGRNLAKRWELIFKHAHFGMGWDEFITRLGQDYFYLDNGAFIEVIAPGASDKAISGNNPIVGIAHLDSLHCFATGNNEFPVVYNDPISGKLYTMHRTRVLRIVDMPSPDPEDNSMGVSAFSRALAIIQAQMLLMRQQIELLSDTPPTGIVTFSGIARHQLDDAMKKYENERFNRGHEVFRGLMELTGVNPNNPVKVDITPFSMLPADFDYDKYMRNHVYMLATAIGIDPQDIMPLSGSSLGSGAQSVILHAKAQGKAFGAILKKLTRLINNDLLPESLEFQFKPKDTEQSQADADTAQRWFTLANEAVGKTLSADEARQLLANTVDSARDVLLDEEGTIRLWDDDTQEDDETVIPDDFETQPATPEGENAPETPVIDDDVESKRRKDIQATRVDFEDGFADLVSAGANDDVTRRRFGVAARALIARGVRSAYLDGLEAGGVPRSELSADDSQAIAALISAQSSYVTAFSKTLYSGGSNIQDFASKSEQWWNKSVYPAYVDGLMSADRNAMYEWSYGDTEHCKDCQRLNGQIHRMKDWIQSGWKPKSSKLDCNGYNCKCEFVKRKSARARGRF